MSANIKIPEIQLFEEIWKHQSMESVVGTIRS